jgi:hypothetical protein
MTVGFEFLSPEQRQAAINQCNSAECQAAVARLTTARNAIPAICHDIASWSSLRTWYAATAATAFAAAGAAAAVAATTAATIPFFGWALATVMWIVAAAFLATALALSTLAANAAIQLGRDQARLDAAQDEFNAALAAARTTCGAYCNIGDSKLPECPK